MSPDDGVPSRLLFLQSSGLTAPTGAPVPELADEGKRLPVRYTGADADCPAEPASSPIVTQPARRAQQTVEETNTLLNVISLLPVP